MRKADFLPIFEMLTVAYGGRLSNDTPTLELFYQVLKDLPVDLVRAAALEYIASPSGFPPVPGQLRDSAVNLQKQANKLPSPAEAWQMVQDAPTNGLVTWSVENQDGTFDIYNAAFQWDFPVVEKVARNLGWPHRFWTDSLAADRARFMNAFQFEIERASQQAARLPIVNAYLSGTTAGIKKLLDAFRKQVEK